VDEQLHDEYVEMAATSGGSAGAGRARGGRGSKSLPAETDGEGAAAEAAAPAAPPAVQEPARYLQHPALLALAAVQGWKKPARKGKKTVRRGWDFRASRGLLRQRAVCLLPHPASRCFH
jgi:hypothetical protein